MQVEQRKEEGRCRRPSKSRAPHEYVGRTMSQTGKTTQSNTRQLSVVGVSVMRSKRRTSNVDAAQHGSIWLARRLQCVGMAGLGGAMVRCDIAVVEYTKSQLSLAVGEPQRIAQRQLTPKSKSAPLGVGQQIDPGSGRVDDETLPQQTQTLLPCRRTAFRVCVPPRLVTAMVCFSMLRRVHRSKIDNVC